jgi:hypothetical protein
VSREVYKNCVQDKWVCRCGVLVSQTSLDLTGLDSVSVPCRYFIYLVPCGGGTGMPGNAASDGSIDRNVE